ncbi:hypothetical protein LZC95_17205 [Pendulispora brunnea]|uniref:Uncharacterized protein n=1 Tax=Pendulispora brunnea TaxID=2905690 RepID=A0ABZ2KMJ7_9BACT
MNTTPSTQAPTLMARARNWLYRKGPEPAPGQWARLYGYLRDLHEHEPRILPALQPIAGLPDSFALLEFHHPTLRIYSGREIILFDESRYLYYRLPGALPNGSGFVEPGRYRLRCRAPRDEHDRILELEKTGDTSFRLLGQEKRVLEQAAPPKAGELDYSWIVGELEDLVVRWLQWHTCALAMCSLRLSQPTNRAILHLARRAPRDCPRLANEADTLARAILTPRK